MKKTILVLLVFLATPIGNTLATPIPLPVETGIGGVSGILVDDLNYFTLTLTGGEVKTDAQELAPPLHPGFLNWPFQFIITLRDTGDDQVILSGNIFHASEPHPPEGAGDPNNFTFIINANNPTVTFNQSINSFTNAIDLHHLNHLDHYNATVLATVSGKEIITWSASFTGRHVPEPSTILLLCSGIVGLLWSGIKKTIC